MRLEIGHAFLGRSPKIFPVDLVHDGNLAAAATGNLMLSDFGHVQVKNILGPVIGGDVVTRRFFQVAIENVSGKTSREVFRHVIGVMRAGARFASGHRDARFKVFPLKVAWQVQVEREVLSPTGCLSDAEGEGSTLRILVGSVQ